MASRTQRVVIGMSGGVDSSVAALLLKEQGYEVVALFMKNWDEEDIHCPAAADYEDVISVCHQLKIPYYAVNFAQQYWDEVFAQCLVEYRAGNTPNPDILCNTQIKFHHFFNQALQLEADYIATGHYCQIFKMAEGLRLARGADPHKDQSYFLYGVKQTTLERVLFPVGHLHKREVRTIAQRVNLVTAKKKDSTGICFIGKRDFKEFLQNYITPNPGMMMTLSGSVVGKHEGIAFYTIGQRKGLAIGGRGAAWYVVGKDATKNILFVEQGEDHPALFCKELQARTLNWIGAPPSTPFRCTAKIRYRTPDAACTVYPGQEGCTVIFDAPQKAVTPQQSIVFYTDEVCLGGGVIHQH